MEEDEEHERYDTKRAGPSVIKVIHEPFKVVSDGNVDQLLRMLNDEENPLQVNMSRWSGFSLLHRAASLGQTDICEVLLQAGARINERSIWGWHSALHLAVGNGWEDCGKFLVTAGANVHGVNKDGLDCCDYAEKKGYRDLAREFRPAMMRLEGIRKLREKKQRAAENAARAAEAQAALQVLDESSILAS